MKKDTKGFVRVGMEGKRKEERTRETVKKTTEEKERTREQEERVEKEGKNCH